MWFITCLCRCVCVCVCVKCVCYCFFLFLFFANLLAVQYMIFFARYFGIFSSDKIDVCIYRYKRIYVCIYMSVCMFRLHIQRLIMSVCLCVNATQNCFQKSSSYISSQKSVIKRTFCCDYVAFHRLIHM